jgi:hypothetical protein
VVPPWDLRPIERILTDQNRVISRFGWQGRKIALYAGNLGEGHLFAEFAAGARQLQETRNAEWLFVFAIRGAGKAALSQVAVGLSNILVLDYLPEVETSHLLSAATVHLISMKPGWEGVIVPSKLYGVLATGAPVLFVGPPDADTATEITRLGCGTCLAPGAPGQAVAEALNRLASDVRQQPIAPDTTGPSRVASFITAEP